MLQQLLRPFRTFLDYLTVSSFPPHRDLLYKKTHQLHKEKENRVFILFYIPTFLFPVFTCFSFFSACKRKDVMEVVEQQSAPKKPRLVFTDLQRRTLQAIFKVRDDDYVKRVLGFQCSFLYGNFYTSFVLFCHLIVDWPFALVSVSLYVSLYSLWAHSVLSTPFQWSPHDHKPSPDHRVVSFSCFLSFKCWGAFLKNIPSLCRAF